MNDIAFNAPIINLWYSYVFSKYIVNYLNARNPLVIRRKTIIIIGIIFGKNIVIADIAIPIDIKANAAKFIYVVNLYITTENSLIRFYYNDSSGV
jgi:hypothetical protein